MKSHFPIAIAAIVAGAAAMFPSPSVAEDMINVYTCRNTGSDSSRSESGKRLQGKAIGSWFPD